MIPMVEESLPLSKEEVPSTSIDTRGKFTELPRVEETPRANLPEAVELLMEEEMLTDAPAESPNTEISVDLEGKDLGPDHSESSSGQAYDICVTVPSEVE